MIYIYKYVTKCTSKILMIEEENTFRFILPLYIECFNDCNYFVRNFYFIKKKTLSLLLIYKDIYHLLT